MKTVFRIYIAMPTALHETKTDLENTKTVTAWKDIKTGSDLLY